MTRSTKRAVADGILRSEVLRLARLVPDVAGRRRTPSPNCSVPSVCTGPTCRWAPSIWPRRVERGGRGRPEIEPAPIREIARRLGDVGSEFSVRFQQTSGMVMAKGVEDCAFYRWTRLTSLTEVGGEPAQFALTAGRIPRRPGRPARRSPATMTALSTHDTKRSEDVRARISVISENAEEWAAAVRRWNRLAPLGDGPLAQPGVAGRGRRLADRPASGCTATRRRRPGRPASRPAGSTPTPRSSERLHALVDAVFDDSELTRRDRRDGGPTASVRVVELVVRQADSADRARSSGRLPGHRAVGPVAGRPGQPAARGLPAAGRAVAGGSTAGGCRTSTTRAPSSCWSPARALRLRRDRPELFVDYRPLAATGRAAEHVFAFDRGGAITVATRLPAGLDAAGGWHDTAVDLPAGSWTDVLTGRSVSGGTTSVGRLLDRYPVALLTRDV